MATCTTTRDGGCDCDHPHCTLCGDCLMCSPHPAHTAPAAKPKRTGR